jgi:hypothetical protein
VLIRLNKIKFQNEKIGISLKLLEQSFFKITSQIFIGRKIDLDHILVFGCISFVHVKRNNKFDKNSIKTIFLGYLPRKEYKCYDPKNKKL